MVGHEAVADQPHRQSLVRFDHKIDECGKVLVFMENVLLSVPSIEHMIDVSTARGSGCSRHAAILAAARGNEK